MLHVVVVPLLIHRRFVSQISNLRAGPSRAHAIPWPTVCSNFNHKEFRTMPFHHKINNFMDERSPAFSPHPL